MNEDLKRIVRERADGACEYCRLPQSAHPIRFQIDHVIAVKHRGPTTAGNLALACLHCNSQKGPIIAGIDRPTRALTKLFNPRRHRWDRHFEWDGLILRGRTAVGRVTVDLLSMNDRDMVELRQFLLEEGRFPFV